MAEKHNMTYTYDKAVILLKEDMCNIYRTWYPIEHIVKESRSIEFKMLIQTGILVYESRDITHFVVPTSKLYDLIQPMEYEYRVCVYDPNQVALHTLSYDREIECRGFVIAAQCKHYGFNYEDYLKGKGKLILIEQQMVKWAPEFSEQEWQDLQQLSLFLQSAIRREISLPLDDDLAPLTLNEAVTGKGIH